MIEAVLIPGDNTNPQFKTGCSIRTNYTTVASMKETLMLAPGRKCTFVYITNSETNPNHLQFRDYQISDFDIFFVEIT